MAAIETADIDESGVAGAKGGYGLVQVPVYDAEAFPEIAAGAGRQQTEADIGAPTVDYLIGDERPGSITAHGHDALIIAVQRLPRQPLEIARFLADFMIERAQRSRKQLQVLGLAARPTATACSRVEQDKVSRR